MRISDWSSDVCSSDLFASGGGASANPNAAVAALSEDAEICGCNGVSKAKVVSCIDGGATTLDAIRATCKASASGGSCTDRKSVVQGKGVAVRVDLGGRRYLTQKTH